MKHVFIINPKSNSEAFTEKFRHKIEELCVNRGLEFEIKSTAKISTRRISRGKRLKRATRFASTPAEGTAL